ncbi:hypothetical protein VTN00DRAFT_3206 [Thermoascus crustaceus]|uniref:uncharacterized protein n=1 Tax=Thermoascus crustaceus TaxID=5088 RepID=UPI0037434CB9
MMFSLNNFSTIANTPTRAPILELFYQALGNKVGAIVLESLVIATGVGCEIACHTWQSRLCWTFARDRGLPFQRYLAKVDKKLDIPFRAHVTSCVIVAILGCLYMASYTAFNSVITGCIVLPYVSYAIPVICLLIKGRSNIQHGPFWLGPFGHIANYVLLCWTLFTLVMYSFPTYMPVQAGSMNYICVVYGVLACIIATDWWARGWRKFKGPRDHHHMTADAVSSDQ